MGEQLLDLDLPWKGMDLWVRTKPASTRSDIHTVAGLGLWGDHLSAHPEHASVLAQQMLCVAVAGPELRLQAPGSINSHLRSYQRAGVKFLFRQYAQGQGGILGDDMVRTPCC